MKLKIFICITLNEKSFMRLLIYCRIFKTKEYDMKNVKMCSDILGVVTFLGINVFTMPCLYTLHGLMV